MQTVEERFWSKVDKEGPNGCWVWTARLLPTGYGSFCGEKRHTRAHRQSWVLANGDIQEGMDIDHICHNRACVNPAHLRLATRAENVRNRLKPSTNKSGYKGVHWCKWKRAWQSKIMISGKSILIGFFPTAESAHEAYCTAAAEYFGEFACSG